MIYNMNGYTFPAEVLALAAIRHSAGGQTRLVHLHEDLLRHARVVAQQVTWHPTVKGDIWGSKHGWGFP